MQSFDAIVLGTGGVGSAALYSLARMGCRVLGLDQFPPSHTHGSSHGQTRIIRQAYFEHPDYVPLLLRAYDGWDAWQQQSAKQLLFPVGLLEGGPPDGTLIPGIRASVQQHNLPIEWLSSAQARQRLPLDLPSNFEYAFEPQAGYLLVDECVRTALQLAERHDARWQQDTVVGWQDQGTHVCVMGQQAEYRAERLIIAGGAWSASLLRNIGVSLRVLTKQQYWLQPDDLPPAEIPTAGAVVDGNVHTKTAQHDQRGGHGGERGARDWPTFFFEMPAGCFYGFPQVTELGVKVAQHSAGLAAGPHPAGVEVPDENDERQVRQFLADVWPAAATVPMSRKQCMYTLSPDEHFIVDRHPECDRVVFAAGLSGHGYKFAPVLGDALAQLATQQATDLPIDFLKLSRFDV